MAVPYTHSPDKYMPTYLKKMKYALEQSSLVINNNIPLAITREILLYFYPKIVEKGMVFFGRGKQWSWYYQNREQEYPFLMLIDDIYDIKTNDNGLLLECNVNATNIWPSWKGVCDSKGIITVNHENNDIHFSFIQIAHHKLSVTQNTIIPSHFELKLKIPKDEEEKHINSMSDYLRSIKMNGSWSEKKPIPSEKLVIDGKIFSYRIEKLFCNLNIKYYLTHITQYEKVPNIDENTDITLSLQAIDDIIINITLPYCPFLSISPMEHIKYKQ